VQLEVLRKTAEVVGKTAGPFGSYSMIMHSDALTEYTKDGHKVLSNFKFYKPLEKSVHDELLGITEHVIKKVGDGTTTAVQLSYLIYESLVNKTEEWIADGIPPYEIITTFQNAVAGVVEEIRKHSTPLGPDEVKQICLISTNGNELISEDIANIYKQFGNEVFIQVGTSNTESSILKTYDGVILNKGYSSPSFINKEGNICEIANPHFYYFPNPVDTPEMIQLFMTIFTNNIYEPYVNHTPEKYIPTVILCPSISQDAASSLNDIEKIFYAYDQADQSANKPPFCIVSGINDRVDNIGDVITLLGCPLIKKYINADQRLKDIEEGNAPSTDTVSEFYGFADLVSIDIDKMKIINPVEMYDKDAEIAEDGSRPYSNTFNALVHFIKQQIEIESKDKNNLNSLISLKKRLHCLTANFVEYNVGGVSAADRDSVRDLVEDAVLNCRSAATNGVGQGAGIEGLCAINTLSECDDGSSTIYTDILNIIAESYSDMVFDLYQSGMRTEEVVDRMLESLHKHQAYNLRDKSFDKNQVLCSIETDIAILEAISKIITIMYTANQAFLVDPMQNAYIDLGDDEE
jgi:hypothetical protein